MSRLVNINGDDYPEAAGKHLIDASSLLTAGRADGAAYLTGYVVECCLKSIYQLETGQPLRGHNLVSLHSQVSAVAAAAGSRTAKYLGIATTSILTSPIGSWQPDMRYRAASMSIADAQTWHHSAHHIFQETIAQMHLDGEL